MLVCVDAQVRGSSDRQGQVETRGDCRGADGCRGAGGGCSASGGSGVDSIAGSLPTNYGPAEQTTLNVGVVPAMDSAGFFVALNEGLFTKEGLKINYSPATSSETAIQQQVAGQLQITAGNYVSYVQAWRSSTSRSRWSPRAR